MKKILLILIGFLIGLNSYSQVKDYTVEVIDSLILNGEAFYVDPSTSADGQFMRRVNGSWINYDFTASGTDSIKLRKHGLDDYYLIDYRGGTGYDSTLIEFDDLILGNEDIYVADKRYLSIVENPNGDGFDLAIVAGNASGGSGIGGTLWLQGGLSATNEYGDINIGVNTNTIKVFTDIDMNSNTISGLQAATQPDEPVILSQIDEATKTVYSISLPYNTTVQARVNDATAGVSYPSDWNLSAGTNSIDLEIEHGMNRRVANVNVFTVTQGQSGNIEQLLRPFSGAFSGWQTLDENTLLINALATTPLPLKIYIIFE